MLLVFVTVAPSPLHGLGLYAAQFIAQGTMVWQFMPGFDLEISAADVEKLPAPAQERMRHYAEYFAEDGKYWLSFDDDRFCNHSDDPNIVTQGGMEMYAARDIQPGEEITCSYNKVIMTGYRPSSGG